jgi:hypothetical protein
VFLSLKEFITPQSVLFSLEEFVALGLVVIQCIHHLCSDLVSLLWYIFNTTNSKRTAQITLSDSLNHLYGKREYNILVRHIN